ncbi:hypothetical protein J5491_00395 [Candidatus Saccharibacteria bacterium]|nr:hypothetical protein [Candidatus Saccharibacteria bacterium]
MDRQEYLNQISASNKPANTKTNGKFGNILSSKILWIVVGAVVLFIILAVLGSVISGSKSGVKEKLYSFDMHMDNSMDVFDKYRNKVKSSTLRSYYTTLSSLIVNVSGDLDSYMAEKYTGKNNTAKKVLGEKKIDQLNLEKDALENELFEAKINGNLDRVFEYKMTYEIATFMNEESDIANSTNDSDLVEILVNSYYSLENLHNQMSGFSESK